jgi:hypothetical protein
MTARKSRRTSAASSGVANPRCEDQSHLDPLRAGLRPHPILCFTVRHQDPAQRAGSASVRRDSRVLVSPVARTDRQTAMVGGDPAWLRTRHALALAEVRDQKTCLIVLAEAEHALGHGEPGSDPAWMHAFDHERLTAARGDCLLRQDQPEGAERAYREALDDLGMAVRGTAPSFWRGSRPPFSGNAALTTHARWPGSPWTFSATNRRSASPGSADCVGISITGPMIRLLSPWTSALPSPDSALAADHPISAEQVVAARRSVDALTVRGGAAYWLEKRPEWGRTVLRRRPISEDVDAPVAVTPDWFDVGSRVHEYGGGAYWVADDGTVFAVHDDDQRIYRLDPDGTVAAVTPETGSPPMHRFADLRTLPGGQLVCVRERHELGRPGAQRARRTSDRGLPPAEDRGKRQGLLLVPPPRPRRQAVGVHLLGPPTDALERHRIVACRPHPRRFPGTRVACGGWNDGVAVPTRMEPGRAAIRGVRPHRLVEPLPGLRARAGPGVAA